MTQQKTSKPKYFDLTKFDPAKQLVLSVKTDIKIPDSDATYCTVDIRAKHSATSAPVPFDFLIPDVFAFGLQETHTYGASPKTRKTLKGYEVNFVLYDKDGGPTESQKQIVSKLREIGNVLKKFCKEERVKLKKPQWLKDNLESIDNMIYIKVDKATMEPVPDALPTYKAKVHCAKPAVAENPWTIKSKFFEKDADAGKILPVEDPLTSGFFQRGSVCTAQVRMESVYCGAAKPYVQSKLSVCMFNKRNDDGGASFVDDLMESAGNMNISSAPSTSQTVIITDEAVQPDSDSSSDDDEGEKVGAPKTNANHSETSIEHELHDSSDSSTDDEKSKAPQTKTKKPIKKKVAAPKA